MEWDLHVECAFLDFEGDKLVIGTSESQIANSKAMQPSYRSSALSKAQSLELADVQTLGHR